MKKIFFALILFFTYFASISAQGAVDKVKLTMVDGVEAKISLFVKWKDANKYIKENEPQVGSVNYHIDANGNITVSDSRKSKNDYIYSPVFFTAKKESDPGNLRDMDYKEDANENVIKICNALKNNGCKYGIGFVDFGDKYVRYIVALKGKKLRVNRYNYYRETNIDYLNFEKAQLEKEKKSKILTQDITQAVLSTVIPTSAKSTNSKNMNFNDWLYKVRHETHELASIGTRKTGGTKIIRWRNIYRDNGNIVHGYVVDLNGNIRSDIFDSRNYEYPILEYYSVPKEIRDLARKSLD